MWGRIDTLPGEHLRKVTERFKDLEVGKKLVYGRGQDKHGV